MGFTPLPNGQTVAESAVTLSNTSGLHEALAVDALELDHGDRIVLVLDCEVRKVSFEALEKDDLQGDLRRVHALHVMAAAQHDTDAVRERLKEQAEKVAAAKGQLPFGEGEGVPEGGVCAHDQLAAECDLCLNQLELDADEAAGAESHLRAVPD